jgi:hypothetical protein
MAQGKDTGHGGCVQEVDVVVKEVVPGTLHPMGACHNSVFVFVSNRSKSGFAENWIQIRLS